MLANATAPSSSACPTHCPVPPTVRKRALALLRHEIEFIPSPDFRVADARDVEYVNETLLQLADAAEAPADLPSHLRRMCRSRLLSQPQESALFREMNYAKYRANALRSRLDPDAVDERLLDEITSLLARAETIRDHIVQANMRLVISIVKKFVAPQRSFDDMLSDGIVTLLHAVEKFDYGRGFRFSTYAYRSITRNAYRAVTTAHREESRLTRDVDTWAVVQDDDGGSATRMPDQLWGELRELTATMLEQLDRRERLIIRSRYALGRHRKVRTFQDLANRLGISKERVRQLEQRAIGKLQKLAADIELDELVGAALI